MGRQRRPTARARCHGQAADNARRPDVVPRRGSRHAGPSFLKRLAAIAAALVIVLGAVQYLRPIPTVQPKSLLPTSTRVPGAPPSLPWPNVGGAAVGFAGVGTVASAGQEKPQPIASVAKVMTALVLLADKPLAAGQQGPSVTITAEDAADYASKRDQGQSVVTVSAGEQLTEYQLLQGLMI